MGDDNKDSKIYDEDLSLFPDIEKYKSQLKELGESNPENTPFDKLYEKFFDLAVIMPQMTATVKPDNFNLHKFFRVRLNIDETKEDLKIIQTYSYPPGHVCKENGRANLKSRSVFYCSNNPICALLESRPKPGDIAYLSIWNGNTARDIKIAVCLPLNLRNENEFQFLANDLWGFAKKHYEQEARDKFDHFFELNKFISERFVNESSPYFLTSWFSDQILYNDQNWRDFILYPSMESVKRYCNMAFHPNTVNQQITFEKVIRLKIIAIDKKDIVFTVGLVGEIDKTNIKWRKVTDKEDKLFNDFGIKFTENE